MCGMNSYWYGQRVTRQYPLAIFMTSFFFFFLLPQQALFTRSLDPDVTKVKLRFHADAAIFRNVNSSAGAVWSSHKCISLILVLYLTWGRWSKGGKRWKITDLWQNNELVIVIYMSHAWLPSINGTDEGQESIDKKFIYPPRAQRLSQCQLPRCI